MVEYIQNLFESAGFMPHGHCYFWQPTVLVSNVLGDGLTALAYLSISPGLIYLTRKRQDLGHKYVFILFALFILFCGFTHLVEIITVWKPVYRAQGVLKIITGLLSITTAFFLYRIFPDINRFTGHKRLQEMNRRLREEVSERERAQIALRQANEALESRVQQRTAQLIKSNRELEREIEQRKKTENDLTKKNQELMQINNDLNNVVS